MLAAFILVTGLALSGQTAGPAQVRLQVFLDCSDCFADYLREETGFVDFVRDRATADVHVIITNTSTGSGGLEYVITLTDSGPSPVATAASRR